jgi:hypothetical protein
MKMLFSKAVNFEKKQKQNHIKIKTGILHSF